jgi:hypothetical protein
MDADITGVIAPTSLSHASHKPFPTYLRVADDPRAILEDEQVFVSGRGLNS